MKARDIILPVITSVAIFGTSVFVSCASQERVDGDGEVQETTVGENGELPPEGDAPPADPTLGELPPEDSGTQAADADSLPPSDTAPPEPLEGADQPLAENNLGELPPDGGDVPPQAEGELPPPADGELPPADETLADNSLPPADAPAADLPPVDDLPPPGDLPPELPADVGRAAYGFNAQTPQIPAEAFSKAGANLNRFYFLRQGDTAQSVAELLYGNASRAKELKKWNRGGFKAGKVVYYQSSSQPDDKQMRSYYQEQGVTPDEYTVKKGESLSTVAAKKLGSAASWKELAVLNGIERPDAVEPGQRLAIYRPTPGSGKDLPSEPARSKRVARNDRSANPPVETITPPMEPPPVDVPSSPIAEEPPPVQAEVPPPVVDMPPPAATPPALKKKSKKPGFGLDIARMLEQNLFFIVIGAGVSVLLLALLAVSKRKKARADAGEFNEDGFATSRAKRR